MEKRKCPEHTGTGLTPKDSECHNHESDTQQRFHNVHCTVIGCPYALSGTERHADVLTIEPRNVVEKILKRVDRKPK